MTNPDFHIIATEKGEGVTYTCGCPCVPTAVPADGAPGFEHCCCGKVHFAGAGAEPALSAYLAGRANRKREPRYTRGLASVGAIEVAWAFPEE